MSAPKPFRFLGLVGGTWISIRMAALVIPMPFLNHVGPHLLPDDGHFPLESGVAAGDLPAPAMARAIVRAPLAIPAVDVVPNAIALRRNTALTALFHRFATLGASHAAGVRSDALALAASAMAAGGPETTPPIPTSEGGAIAPAAPVGVPGRHWSGSAWAFVRQGSGPDTLATAGQLGGSQAGARIAYRFDPGVPLAAFGRLSAPIEGSPGAEAAIGLDWQPARAVPVRVSVERRIALDRGGRDAFAALAAGGVDNKPLPGGLRLDGYAQAGVVGARRRDLFADGGARAGRPFSLSPGGRASLTVGGGLWGAAQPHVSRVDVGPSAALRLPIGNSGIVAAADWRFRIAGNARPGSGPALTIGVDF